MSYIPRAVLNELWSDANCNILGDKSFADDLNLERGIVNSREALLPRAIEIHPQFSDLFIHMYLYLFDVLHPILLLLLKGHPSHTTNNPSFSTLLPFLHFLSFPAAAGA